MFNALKDQALEIDTKIGTLRKQCTTLATGYVEEDVSKEHSVRERLTSAGQELRRSTAECDNLFEQAHGLFTLLTEADKAADEIYDSVIKFYHAQGVKLPSIELPTVEVGFPIHLLPLPGTSTVNRSREESSFSAEEDSSDSVCLLEDELPEVYISRRTGDNSVAPETPMISSRKRLF